jgi:hypothetical protein
MFLTMQVSIMRYLVIITVVIFTSGMFPVGDLVHGADFYVDFSTGLDSNPGLTWTDAVKTITQGLALSSVSPGSDTVHVAAGTYRKDITLVEQTVLLGGYPTGGGPRDSTLHRTVIRGTGDNPVVTGADNATIDGFIITGANRTGVH